MGVLLHAHYRLMGPNGQKIVMPAPVDKATPNAPWWRDNLANQAADFRRAGFSAVLLPPICKTASGTAQNGQRVQVGRIWCQSGIAIEAQLNSDVTGWSASAAITVDILGAQGEVWASKECTAASARKPLNVTAKKSEWATLRLTGQGLPVSGSDYALNVTYTAPQELAA